MSYDSQIITVWVGTYFIIYDVESWNMCVVENATHFKIYMIVI